MKIICQECKIEFNGRIDAKFCSSDCRSGYHNRQNYYKKKMVRQINGTLWRNRQILERLNPEGKCNVTREKLLENGFNFKYFTNEYETKSGNSYRFCYDYGYIATGNDYYTLVKRQEYVD